MVIAYYSASTIKPIPICLLHATIVTLTRRGLYNARLQQNLLYSSLPRLPYNFDAVKLSFVSTVDDQSSRRFSPSRPKLNLSQIVTASLWALV